MGSTSMATSSNIEGLHQVFVYGSLLADEVVRVLLKRVPQSSPATLNGFHRFSIKGRVYPAILPVEKKKVIGRVLSGITPLELHIFDIFEDVEYKRCTVEVSLMHGGFLQDGSQKLQAHAYVWANSGDPNLYGDWIFEEWRQAQMKDFIKMTMRFMEELEQPESKARVETYESFYQPSG
ncbi:AIG2-like protein D isoform X6 [Camellia sinensis]|uniref:AIG2-like protein D isoform X6 n=1 Tax=Camellia sinensis TaxID=4442 RepID=UPI001036084E|nr:AIG2-like protein D isoform X6 [Camellia sinensis]